MNLVGTRNQVTRDEWVRAALQALPAGARLLDAGAGEQQYRKFCGHLKYVSQDAAQYDPKAMGTGLQMESWDFKGLDLVCDIKAIPEPDSSFDAILCTEVFEHIPDPVPVVREFARLLKPGGGLLLTAPFCSLTHFAPYHFASGFGRFWYEHHLPAAGFRIEELVANGNYFEYIAQETRRLPDMAERYAKTKPGFFERWVMKAMLRMLNRWSQRDQQSAELLAFGFHVRATKVGGAQA